MHRWVFRFVDTYQKCHSKRPMNAHCKVARFEKSFANMEVVFDGMRVKEAIA